MPARKSRSTPRKPEEIIADAVNAQTHRQQGYREQALAIFPHICSRCGREFAGKNLRELTVHHRDHNHMNNPPDGGNWELLCLYCHDDEHSRSEQTGIHDGTSRERHSEGSLGFNPFAGLGKLIEPETRDAGAGEP